MANLSCQLLRIHLKRMIRQCQPVRYKVGQGAYEGEGKTTVTILNKDADYGLMIDKISMQGFKLNLGVSVLGPMIIFPRTVLGWNITQVEDINNDSMTLFRLLDPRPDIMILGLDKKYPREAKFINDFENIVHSLGAQCEILPVDKACTTFNFLNAERRYAVGILLPPNNIDDCDMDSINEMATRRWLQQNWDKPVEEKYENPNSLTQVLFPSEENKKVMKAEKERKAAKKAQRNKAKAKDGEEP